MADELEQLAIAFTSFLTDDSTLLTLLGDDNDNNDPRLFIRGSQVPVSYPVLVYDFSSITPAFADFDNIYDTIATLMVFAKDTATKDGRECADEILSQAYSLFQVTDVGENVSLGSAVVTDMHVIPGTRTGQSYDETLNAWVESFTVRIRWFI